MEIHKEWRFSLTVRAMLQLFVDINWEDLSHQYFCSVWKIYVESLNAKEQKMYFPNRVVKTFHRAGFSRTSHFLVEIKLCDRAIARVSAHNYFVA